MYILAPGFPHEIFAYENALTDSLLAHIKSFGYNFRVYRTNWPNMFEEYIVMDGESIVYNHAISSNIWSWIESYHKEQEAKRNAGKKQ